LSTTAVAEGQRRRDLPGRDGDREVPRRDEADHADRLARDFDADAGRTDGTRSPFRRSAFAGEELEDVAGAGHFADGFGQGLAFFAREQVAQFGLARQDLGAGGVEDVEALLRRRQAPGDLRLHRGAMACAPARHRPARTRRRRRACPTG
jgi:hypothetical protein